MIQRYLPFTKVPAHRYLFIGIAALYLMGIGWGLPNTVDWAVDSVAPYYPLTALGKGFSGDFRFNYGYVHLFILALLDLPILLTAFLSTWLDGSFSQESFLQLIHTSFWATPLILLDRAVTVAMTLGLFWMLYRLVTKWMNASVAFWTIVFLALHSTMLFYGHQANLEVPYLFWCVASFSLFAKAVSSSQRIWYLWWGITSCLALCTKDMAYSLLWVPVAFYPWLIKRYSISLPWTNLFWGIGFAMLIFPIAWNIPFNGDGFMDHFRFIIQEGSQSERIHPFTWVGIITEAIHTIILFIKSGGWAFFIIGCIGGVLLIKRFKKDGILWMILAIFPAFFGSFLLMTGYVYVRWLLVYSIPFAIFAGYGMHYLWKTNLFDKGKRFSWLSFMPRTILMGLLVLHFLSAVPMLGFLLGDNRENATYWMDQSIKDPATIETVSAYTCYLPRLPKGLSYSIIPEDLDHDPPESYRERNSIQLKFQADYVLLSSLHIHHFWDEPIYKDCMELEWFWQHSFLKDGWQHSEKMMRYQNSGMAAEILMFMNHPGLFGYQQVYDGKNNLPFGIAEPMLMFYPIHPRIWMYQHMEECGEVR